MKRLSIYYRSKRVMSQFLPWLLVLVTLALITGLQKSRRENFHPDPIFGLVWKQPCDHLCHFSQEAV